MEQIRFEATQVIAPQGKGKTQLLQRQILKDIRDPDKPYVIVIDSRGQMLPVLRKLKDFEGNDRLIYLSPDMGNGYSPALNMFAPSKRNYTGILKESIEAGVLESFHYIFENIMELSSRQDTAFSFLVRLMLSMKVANITTLHDVIDDQLHLGAKASLESSAYRDDILKLDDTAIRFFRNVYFTKGYGVTRQAISERLYGLVNIPSFKRMFDAPTREFDMFDAMQAPDGKVILIDTAQFLLKRNASSLFGKFIIAKAMDAVVEQVTIPEKQWRPGALYVDECSEYFGGATDSSLTQIIQQLRKYLLAITFAHQDVQQLSSPHTRSAIQSTATKYAAGLPSGDAEYMSRDMRCEPSDLMNTVIKRRQSGEWMCFQDGYPRAIKLTVPFGVVENEPPMSAKAQEDFMDKMRARYCYDPAAVPTPQPTPQPPPKASKQPHTTTKTAQPDPDTDDDEDHTKPGKFER